MTTTYIGSPNAGWKTSVKLPDDNNKPTSASIAAMVIPIMDDLAFLKMRGIQAILNTASTAGGSSSEVIGPAGQINVWQDFATASGLAPFVQLSNCIVGDTLLCFVTAPFAQQSGAAAHVRLSTVQDVGGVAAQIPITGTERRIEALVAVDVPQHIAIIGRVGITNAGTCRVQLQGRNQTSNTDFKVGIPGGLGHVLNMIVFRLQANV